MKIYRNVVTKIYILESEKLSVKLYLSNVGWVNCFLLDEDKNYISYSLLKYEILNHLESIKYVDSKQKCQDILSSVEPIVFRTVIEENSNYYLTIKYHSKSGIIKSNIRTVIDNFLLINCDIKNIKKIVNIKTIEDEKSKLFFDFYLNSNTGKKSLIRFFDIMYNIDDHMIKNIINIEFNHDEFIKSIGGAEYVDMMLSTLRKDYIRGDSKLFVNNLKSLSDLLDILSLENGILYSIERLNLCKKMVDSFNLHKIHMDSEFYIQEIQSLLSIILLSNDFCLNKKLSDFFIISLKIGINSKILISDILLNLNKEFQLFKNIYKNNLEINNLNDIFDNRINNVELKNIGLALKIPYDSKKFKIKGLYDSDPSGKYRNINNISPFGMNFQSIIEGLYCDLFNQ